MPTTAPTPKTARRIATGRTRVQASVPPEVARWIDETAALTGESREVIIRAVLRDAIQKADPEKLAKSRAWWRAAGEQIEGGVYHWHGA